MEKPFVFVSSAIGGMKQVRSRVRKLLEQDLSYRVIISENEGSKSRTPINQCKRWARNCDIYIAILGYRYGWIVPRTSMSVTEMEFNEARKDNPEKILVYVSAKPKEQRQEEFVKRIEDFSEGYFRRKPFKSDSELIAGIREDLAEFLKERLDFLKVHKLKIRPSRTPALNQYITVGSSSRGTWMMRDAVKVAESLGFNPVKLTQETARLTPRLSPRHLHLFTGTRRVAGNRNVLFSIWVISDNLTHDYLRSYNFAHQYYVSHAKEYDKHPDRFSIFLVHGNVSKATFVRQMQFWGKMTCFDVEPGVYFGVGLYGKVRKMADSGHENMLFLPQVKNEEVMVSKLADALEWLDKEARNINFRCNYRVLTWADKEVGL